MNPRLILPILLAASSVSSRAAVVFFDDFSGDNASFLSGTTPDVNTLGTNPLNTWSATTTGDTTFRADGAMASIASNVDVGTWLNLGAGFMQANQTYTLTIDYANLTNGVMFFGFVDIASPVLTTRGQTQGNLGVGIRVRNITGGTHVSAYRQVGGVETSSVIATGITPTTSGSYSLVIQSNNLTNATASIGDATVNFDATNLNQLFLAFEDNGASSGTFNSVTIDQVPEPSTALLGAFGALALLRRRR